VPGKKHNTPAIRIIGPSIAYLSLSKGRMFSLIDSDDADLLEQHTWYAQQSHRAWYACRKTIVDGKRKNICVHHLLLPNSVQPDHINRHSLDNRRVNLRDSTVSQNMRNRVLPNKYGLAGVSASKPHHAKPWRATIVENCKKRHLGYFATKEMAHAAYWEAAQAIAGEFASR
jgi:hypothetical protein